MAAWNESANHIFLRALEIESPGERLRYVAAACQGQPEIGAEVERLLAAQEAMGQFLDQPLLTLPEPLRSDMAALPQRVGSYRILEEIGEGGMGIVYRAVQEEPVRRQVALKIIKPGLDTRQVISRFEAERQVLAMMEHPNIARIIDGGTTELGRPFFVMELVPGIPITRYCRDSRLSLRDRLLLFQEICRAVQHAHHKGIIHRDLKPSNILVTQIDGQPVVKVIDFGVAKAVGRKLTDQTLYTRFMQMVGTPTYMSPEQASLSATEVDTRSDVYSLGVLLYELLTGTTPFAADRLQQATEPECRRIICEEEPSLPSARLTTLGAEAVSTLVGTPHLGLEGLRRRVRGELDWIVMQAIEKDRARRYQSPAELAEDLRRYLADEPVAACPQSRWYSLRKSMRRNRAVMTTAALVLGGLLTGAGFAIWQSLEATRARAIADVERDRAQNHAEQFRSLLYASDLRLATLAWQRSDARKLQELLDRHIPRDGEKDLRGFEWYFLARHSTVAGQALLTTDRPLYFVAASRDGKQLAAAGAAGEIFVFDARSGALRQTLPSGQIEVNGLAFSSDGKLLYSAGDNGTVVEWKLASGQPSRVFPTGLSRAYQVGLNARSRRLVACGMGPEATVVNMKTGKLLDPLRKHALPIECLALMDSGLLALGSSDFHASLWDVTTGELRWALADAPSSTIKAIAVSPSERLVAIGHDNGRLTIRKSADGAVVAQISMTDAIQSLAFSPLDRTGLSPWLAVGERGGTIRLLPNDFDRPHLPPSSAATVAERGRLWMGHPDRVYSLTFSPDGRTLYSAGGDGVLKSWTLQDATSTTVLPQQVCDFRELPSGELITAGEAILRQPVDGTIPATEVFQMGTKCRRVAHERAREQLILQDFFQGFAEVPLGGAASANRWTLDVAEVGCFAVHPERPLLAASVMFRGSKARAILFREPEALREIPVGSICHDLILTENGDLIVDQVRDLWILSPGATSPTRRLLGHRAAIWDLDLSKDQRFLASASKDRTARIWDLHSGEQVWSELAHLISTNVVAFSPSGDTLATSGDDGMLRLWRWRERTLVLESPLSNWPVQKLAFSSDGRRLYVLANEQLTILSQERQGR